MRQYIKMNAKRNTINLKIFVSQENAAPITVGLLYLK